MEILGSFISKWVSSQVADISVSDSDTGIDATVGNFGRVVSTPLKDERGRQMTMQNAGFATAFRAENDTLQLAPSNGTHWSDPELPHVFQSRSGAVAACQWSGD